MSKLSEYVSLLPEAFPSSIKIMKAIINDVKLHYNHLPEEKKKEIIRRRKICKECPFNSRNSEYSKEYYLLTGAHYRTDREDEHCSFCGCPVTTRTASLGSNCGIEFWNKNNPSKQLELK